MKKYFLSILTIIIIVSLLPINLVKGSTKTFDDLNSLNRNFIQKNYVDWAINRDLIRGYNDNTFRPYEKITESQFMYLIYRNLKLSDPNSYFDYDWDVKNNEEIYSKLRELGIMSKGTNYSDLRSKNITEREATTILLSAFTNFRFISSEERINSLLDELKIIKENFWNLNKPLTRIAAIKLLKDFDYIGNHLVKKVDIDKTLGDYELHYFGDWNKRLFYYYPESGIELSITKVEKNTKKENFYYNQKTGKSFKLNIKKDNYLITLRSHNEIPLEFYGYGIIMTDTYGAKVIDEISNYIGLIGESQLTSLVTGEKIKDIKVVLGKNVLSIDLKKLKKFPGNRFYSDRGNGMEWNTFYVGDEVGNTFDQVERHLYLNSINE